MFIERLLHVASPGDVSEATLQNFLDQRLEETGSLEYKGGSPLPYDKVLRAVASMANADGGLVLVGIGSSSDAKGNRQPTFLQWIKDPRRDGKDALENRIATRLEPSAVCNVHTIWNADRSGFVLMVDVPPSPFPPHMFDGIYPKRSGSRTLAMHHFEVLDALNRSRFPVLSAVGHVLQVIDGSGSRTLLLAIGVHNEGRQAAEHSFIKISLPDGRGAFVPLPGWVMEGDIGGIPSITRYENVRPVIPGTTQYQAWKGTPLALKVDPADQLLVNLTWGSANAPVQNALVVIGTASSGVVAPGGNLAWRLHDGQSVMIDIDALVADWNNRGLASHALSETTGPMGDNPPLHMAFTNLLQRYFERPICNAWGYRGQRDGTIRLGNLGGNP